jgi:diguanylate cyclase (GGDEF)-like protein
MLNDILIAILSALVIVLTVLLWLRHRSESRGVSLNREAVDELLSSFLKNLKQGRIQDIAGTVSSILRKHLKCGKIVYLRYYKGNLELNFVSGLRQPDKDKFRIRLYPNVFEQLRQISEISPVNKLQKLLPPEFLDLLTGNGLEYFFPVYNREQLYGLYFVTTALPLNSNALRLLSTTLAFNLSTAYHIGNQESRLKNAEQKIKSFEASIGQAGKKGFSTCSEMTRCLKIRESKRLTTELVRILGRECSFSRLMFCVKSSNNDKASFSIDGNIQAETNLVKESYDIIIKELNTGKISDLSELSQMGKAVKPLIKKLREDNIKYITLMPWYKDEKAMLAWAGPMSIPDVLTRLKSFRSDAMPLVENARRIELMEEMSYTDGLTGVYNFRFFRDRISEELHRAERYGRFAALLIFDIDDLKTVNDKHGHLAGDHLLKSFADILAGSVRSIDVVCRYGGDEFCLIMPETSRQRTRLFMERFQENVISSRCRVDGVSEDLKYSVSIGGAVFPVDGNSVDSLIHSADMALLQAKAEGGKRARLCETGNVQDKQGKTKI